MAILYDSLIQTYQEQPTSALKSAFALMEMDRIALPDTVWANTPLIIGYILEEQGLMAQSLDFSSLAIHRKVAIGQKNETGYLHIDIGNIYFAQNQYDKAREMYLQAIDIFQDTKFGNGIYTSLNNLGRIAMEQNSPRQALKYFQKAAAVIEQYELEQHIFAFSYRLFKNAYHELGKGDSSRYYTEQLMKISGPRDKFYNRGLIQQLKGEMLLADGDTSRALHYFSEAEKDFRSPVNVYYLLNLYDQMIQVLFEQGETVPMMAAIERSNLIASEHNFINYQISNARILNEYYEKSAQPQKQLQISLKLNKLYQKAEQSNKELQNQRIKTQSLLHEFLNRMELQEKKLLNARRLRNTLLLFGSFLIIIIALLIVRHLQKKRLHQLILQQEKQLHEKTLELERAQASELKRDMLWKSIQLHEMNSFLDLFREKLNRHLEQKGSIDKKDSTALIREIQSKMQQENRWEEFEAQFIKTNPGFFERLDEICPGLTPREKKICAYHRMRLDTKDIAELTSTSVRTVQNHRYRIRTKFALPEEISFQTFIDKI